MHASVINEVTQSISAEKRNLGQIFAKCDRFVIVNEIRTSKGSETTSVGAWLLTREG